MKIEKLRKSHRKEIIIGIVLFVVIGGALTFRLTHSKYRFTQSIDLAEGIIHYKAPDFKIMSMYQQKEGKTCTEDSCYDEITDRMPSSGYVVNEDKSYCTLNSEKDDDVKLYTNNLGEHVVLNLIKGDKCYLYFDIKPITVYDLIAKYKNVSEKTSFSSIATSDEGVFKASDNDGTSYYWRGAATTNHVIFANKCWRIVRINGDKTIRLIYNGEQASMGKCAILGKDTVFYNSTTVYRYYATIEGNYNNPSYVGWTFVEGAQTTLGGTESNAKIQTEKWYEKIVGAAGSKNDEKVASGKFCNDRGIGSNSSWNTNYAFYYQGYLRLVYSKSPTLICPNEDTYTLKVGAITADEVAFAGGVHGSANSDFYLKADHDYWTMTPHGWNGGFAYVMKVYYNGFLSETSVNDDEGLRPVINLNADTVFKVGTDGTQNNPYVVQ